MSNTQYLVIGATGKTGKRVTARLVAANKPVKAASRTGDVRFDWQDKSNWPEVFGNVKAVYVTYFPDLAMPGAQEDISTLCTLARQQQVEHITLLSGRGEEEAQACEQIVVSCGLSWTIVRASWFMQNFSEGLFAQFLLSGDVSLPVGDVKEPFVDVDDIADIVFDSMISEKHQNRLYEVTGATLYSFAELVALFNRVLGRDVKFTTISANAFSNNLTRLGVDQGTISMLDYLFTEVLDGRNEKRAKGVQQALGREPTSFEAFLRKNQHVFV